MVNAKTVQREHPIRQVSQDYPTIILGEPGKEHPLPGIPGVIKREKVKDHKNVIILGERSGGVRDCLGWWCEVLNESNLPWAFVQSAHWMPSLVLTSLEGQEETAVKAKIERIADLQEASEKANALVELASMAEVAKNEDSLFYLIVRDFSGLGGKGSEALADAFRLIRDLNRCPGLHFVVGSDSESYFADDVFSGLLSMAHRYRLKPFTEEEVRDLCHASSGNDSIEPDLNALKEILKATGGQPALVQDLLSLLRMPGHTEREISEKVVRAAFRKQRRSPPGVTQAWKAELKKILRERPELVDPMRRYVSGVSLGPARFPPPSKERPLMIAGWLRLLDAGRWGICSDLHADLAREVLDSPGD